MHRRRFNFLEASFSVIHRANLTWRVWVEMWSPIRLIAASKRLLSNRKRLTAVNEYSRPGCSPWLKCANTGEREKNSSTILATFIARQGVNDGQKLCSSMHFCLEWVTDRRYHLEEKFYRFEYGLGSKFSTLAEPRLNIFVCFSLKNGRVETREYVHCCRNESIVVIADELLT